MYVILTSRVNRKKEKSVINGKDSLITMSEWSSFCTHHRPPLFTAILTVSAHRRRFVVMRSSGRLERPRSNAR